MPTPTPRPTPIDPTIKRVILENQPHPLEFEDFHDVWVSAHQPSGCDQSARDAYDAYLAGISEVFQQKARTCTMDETLGYVDLITRVVYLRRSNAVGMRDGLESLSRERMQ